MNGGRFVPVGVRAVYASIDEATALREVTNRKSVLGGRIQIDVGEYPRMTYILPWPRGETSISLRRFRPSWQPSSGDVSAGTSIWLRRRWRQSGLRRVSRASCFHRQLAPDETSRSIWRMLHLIALLFATALRYWRPFAGYVP